MSTVKYDTLQMGDKVQIELLPDTTAFSEDDLSILLKLARGIVSGARLKRFTDTPGIL